MDELSYCQETPRSTRNNNNNSNKAQAGFHQWAFLLVIPCCLWPGRVRFVGFEIENKLSLSRIVVVRQRSGGEGNGE